MRSWLMCRLLAQFLEDRDFAVTGRHADDGLDLAGRRIVAETRAEDVICGDDAFERRLDHFFGRGRDHVEREAMPVQIF